MHYQWSTKPVPAAPLAKFAEGLEQALNELEAAEYEIDDVMDAPGGHAMGVIIVAKKPRRFPAPPARRPAPGDFEG